MSADQKAVAKGSRFKLPVDLISSGKDLVALLRDSALFILAFLLLVFPASFNTLLTKAGFEEGSLVGFKWKSKLVESDAALKEARATITDLKVQLDKTSQALADTEAKLNDPDLKEKLAKLQEENKQVNASSSRVETSVSDTIAANAPLVEKAQTSVSNSGSWGVVFSGDATIDAAKYEAQTIAPKLGIPSAAIFHDRNGSFRCVSVVESRAQAEQVLTRAKQRRADAYIVNMANWCPTSTDKGEYRECVPQ
jgi:uncharacterized protein YfcZ (UPF0381/DUF406 family)